MESLGGILRRITQHTGEYEPEPAPGPELHDVCRGTGWVNLHVPVGDPRFGKSVPCRCTVGDRPTFENFHHDPDQWPHLSDAHAAVFNWSRGDGPPILWLMGVVGTGKSHLSLAATWEITRRGGACLWIAELDLIQTILTSFGAHTTDEYIGQFDRLDWVVIDDFGQPKRPTENVQALLEGIIDKRWKAAQRGKRTLITSNYKSTDFDGRTASRLGDVALVKAVATGNAPDYRRFPHGIK